MSIFSVKANNLDKQDMLKQLGKNYYFLNIHIFLTFSLATQQT